MFYHLLVYDIIEIFFYTLVLYNFCILLKTDKTKNLLFYFLSYCVIIITTWALEFPTLSQFLLSYAPVTLILFIVMHEKTLQRNLVSLRAIVPTQQYHDDWLDCLLSSALIAINNNKSITIVIENKDPLEYFLETPFFINASLNKDILAILLSSESYDAQKIIWVTTQGQIRGINAIWQTRDVQKQVINRSIFDASSASFYSLQCDAIVIHRNQFMKNFTVITHGKQIENINSGEIKNTVKKYLLCDKSTKPGDFSRETHTHRTTHTE